MPGIWDHLLLVVLMVVLPIWGLRENTHKRREVWRTSRAQRKRTFFWIICVQWVLLAVMLSIWLGNGRAFADLQLIGPLQWRFWVGGGLCVAVIALSVVQHRSVLADANQRQKISQMLDRRAPFMPRSTAELPLLAVVCITAGVCEEFLYRGWLFWYLSSYMGASAFALAGVVVAAAVIFAIAHSYQGTSGLAEVFGVALIFGGLYVLMQSLWMVMILHFAIDLNAGVLAARLHGRGRTDPTDDSPDT